MARKRKRKTPRDSVAKPTRKHEAVAAPASAPANRNLQLAAFAALPLLILAAYFPATWAGFVWDDFLLTMARPVLDTDGIFRLWLEPRAMREHEGHYWPLLYSTFWLEHKIWGFEPLGYHLVNLILHACVAALLWRLLLRLQVPGAFFAAAIFAVHPLHVEPALWIIGRKDLLSGAFYLLAAHAYLRFADTRNPLQYAGALFAFVAALLCKSIVVTLPAALFLWHWWQRRMRGAELWPLLPLLVVGLGITAADTAYYQNNEHVDFGYSLLEKLLLAAHALGFHTAKLFWPDALAVVYAKWEVTTRDWIGWGCAAGGALIIAALWLQQRRIGRAPLVGVLFFAGTLAPTLGFVDYGYQQFSFVADRYQYLASAGLIALFAAAATLLWRHFVAAKTPGWFAAIPAVALLAGLGAIAWQHAAIYETPGIFFRHIIAHNPDARGAHHLLANYMREQGEYEAAVPYYDVAIARRPDDFAVNNNIGINYYNLGRYGDAITHYERAIVAKPARKLPRMNLAIVHAAMENYPEALKYYRQVAEIDPNDAIAHAYIGDALYRLGRAREALRSYERALVLDAGMEEVRRNRDLLRQQLGGVQPAAQTEGEAQ